ncbi:DUF2125 domain-containing protein [Microvirga tunisiensis]|uniref:DUF2125 domain-containing protein n=1 Tax=Pannonibacter tanglangensis TaxID=2750084 RepID=A0A7X5F842_9HYPH|nr:DUF2125 domain-containing protein [Pannonibacter sp. XCT-53]NBN80244.1 DUF2125 domain-containing protein [Pannonibacter sp. XCT-53]
MTSDQSSAGAPASKRPPRKYVLLATAVAVVIGGWSAAWFGGRSYLDGEITRMMDVAMANGVEVACLERKIGGFPFRFEVSCKDFAFRDPLGGFFSVSDLRAVALVYNPMHLIVEADSPMAAFRPDSPIQEASWTSFRASLRYSTAGVTRLDAVLQEPRFFSSENPTQGEVVMKKAELHLRADPERPANLDLALSFAGLKTGDPDHPGTDGAFVGEVAGAAPLLGGTVPLDLFASTQGVPAVTIDSLSLTSGTSGLSTSGLLKLPSDGFLTGELPLTAIEPGQIRQVLAPLFPVGSPFPEALQGALVSFGKPGEKDGRPAIDATLSLAGGTARIGILPIAQMQSVY